jgi:deoxyribodipyrimidine photolyase-related protein
VQHILILGDQLNLEVFGAFNPESTQFLMLESTTRGRTYGFHKQKLALVYAAMRHFRLELEARGFKVHYRSCQVFADGLKAHFGEFPKLELGLIQPSDFGVDSSLSEVVTQLGGSLKVFSNPLWLSSNNDFDTWAQGKKEWRMEFFYREMRKKTAWLMDGGQPLGGTWNFDADNRQVPKLGHKFPQKLEFKPDSITLKTLDWVEETFKTHSGSLEGFNWAVTRVEALQALTHFLEHRLADFGPFEDAMVEGEHQLYHSLLSPAINIGLLSAKEVCVAALEFAAKTENNVPLQSIEGFIRQILGWREFMYHVYRLQMPALRLENQLGANRALPDFYWTGKTQMRCVSSAVTQVLATGHTHHIQRLMVLGNFALLAGISPQAINDWFLSMYVDAFDWVVTPNVIGMSQYANAGGFTSKPYIAGGAYISRMSNHCKSCAFNPKLTSGETACPFSSLYWGFIDRHLETFKNNPRMGIPISNWNKRDPVERNAILERNQEVLALLEQNLL